MDILVLLLLLFWSRVAMNKLRKLAVVVLKKRLRVVEFNQTTSRHHHDSVRLNNGIDSTQILS